jgi:hypothetical protein
MSPKIETMGEPYHEVSVSDNIIVDGGWGMEDGGLNQNQKDWYTDLTDQSRIRQIDQSSSAGISLIRVPFFLNALTQNTWYVAIPADSYRTLVCFKTRPSRVTSFCNLKTGDFG